MRLLSLAALSATAMILLDGCTTAPVTGRRQLSLISPAQEMQLGLTSFEQIKKDTKISNDPALNALLQKVGKRIAQVSSKDMPNAQWEFVVFDSKEANAFCLPGGKVGVYTGILPITKDETGLATVVGHEVAHAVARHGGERMSEAMVAQGLGDLAGAYVGSSKYAQYQNVFMGLYGAGAQVAVLLPHSRTQESEADHIGLVYMARAGYNPQEAVGFWQRFAEFNRQQGDGSTPSFLRTHPLDETRIKQLQQWMPEALAEYNRGKP